MRTLPPVSAVASDTAVRFSPDTLHLSPLSESVRGTAVIGADSSKSPQRSVLSGSGHYADVRPMVHSSSRMGTVTGSGGDHDAFGPGAAAAGLAPERRRLEQRGLTAAVISTIQGSSIHRGVICILVGCFYALM
ncbi:hypothetical protein AAFF_G00122480 [Aldrovandia affinis]|uniref:Uncharacterized protein n=1 Tax=Aldrovandia affinis TaxID=143900 RepID=A0AAD7RRT1_9TELE|nr:hypothetical protein AAFF_G00122480 [Aldrovandia affinis]